MRLLLYMATVTSVAAIRAMGCAESYYSWAPAIAKQRAAKKTQEKQLKKVGKKET